MSEKFTVEGVEVDALSADAAIGRICDDVVAGPAFSVFTINLDHVVKLRRLPAFRTAYASARYVLADGWPIALAGRLRGIEVRRTTGSDLIEPLCREAARRGLPVAFYGSTEASLAAAAAELKRRVPGLEIAAMYAPGMIDPLAPSEPEGVDSIRRSAARICFLALGAPKQEVLAARMANSMSGPMAMICIGAGLDFLAGHQTRAPKAFRTFGGEWLWRLVTDPVRMTGRYLDCFKVLPSVLMSSTRIVDSGVPTKFGS